jgi:two-component system cell cycle response regulator
VKANEARTPPPGGRHLPPGARRLLRRSLATLLLGGTAVVALHDWLGLGTFDMAIGEVIYDAVILGAGLACLVRASDYRPEHTAWTLLGIAILCWGAGEVYWSLEIEGNPSAPYPSPADIGYLAFYPFAYAGLATLVRARADEINWRLWMDGLIAALGTAALGTAFVFDFVADKATGSTLEQLTTLAYPLGDIVMVSIVVGVVALTGWRPGRTWSLLLAGLSALVIADIAFTLQSTEGTLPGGDWIDPIYLIAAVCLAAAVWQPTEAASITSQRDDRREIIVPAVFATVMIGLFAMRYYDATGSLSTILWAATMAAVIIRLTMSDRENRRLLDQVRTDPLTGLGNRGRMQVDLERACERAEAAQPAMLYLFDLNGFKRYNDTFGHPAGDELLTRLGAELRATVSGDGTAYRIGGDEFVVLIERGDDDLGERVMKRAAEALTTSGKGYDVSASWGKVVIPAEARTPAEAMQLADVRMYAQKESRRVASSGGDDGIEIDGSAVSVELNRPRDGEALEQGQ